MLENQKAPRLLHVGPQKCMASMAHPGRHGTISRCKTCIFIDFQEGLGFMVGAEGFEPPTLWSQSTSRILEPFDINFHRVRESFTYRGPHTPGFTLI
jgi:hypothetical protein